MQVRCHTRAHGEGYKFSEQLEFYGEIMSRPYFLQTGLFIPKAYQLPYSHAYSVRETFQCHLRTKKRDTKRNRLHIYKTLQDFLTKISERNKVRAGMETFNVLPTETPMAT